MSHIASHFSEVAFLMYSDVGAGDRRAGKLTDRPGRAVLPS